MDLLVTWALVGVYTPLAGISPHQAAHLGAGPAQHRPRARQPAPGTAPGPGAERRGGPDAGRLRMAARPADIRYDLDKVHTEVMVTNPAGHARGHARDQRRGHHPVGMPACRPRQPSRLSAPRIAQVQTIR